MMTNILLTGTPGIGKTTAIRKIVSNLDSTEVAGFWSSEIRIDGRRVGFAIETISGEKGILAHVDFKEGPRVGKYSVNVSEIESIIVPELVLARESGHIIVIDEIAKMELYSQRFLQEIRKCLNTKHVLGAIQERRHQFLDEVRSRRDVTLFELTTENRDKIPLQILQLLGQES